MFIAKINDKSYCLSLTHLEFSKVGATADPKLLLLSNKSPEWNEKVLSTCSVIFKLSHLFTSILFLLIISLINCVLQIGD